MNFNQPWMKHSESPEEEKPKLNTKKLGSYKEGRYTVTDEEIAYINKSFVMVHALRQDYLLNNKKQSHLAKVVSQ
jgi:hypothetical protein